MTPPVFEAHRTPPRSRPLLRVVENYQPAVNDHGPPPAPAPAPETGSQRSELQLVDALCSADSRIDSVAARMESLQEDLRLVREALAELDQPRSTWATLLRYALVVALIPALLALAWAGAMALPTLAATASSPYPPLLAVLAVLVGTTQMHVAASRLLLCIVLPAGSLLAVFAGAICLRLKWRRGLAVFDR